MSTTIYRIKEQGHSKETTFIIEKLVSYDDGSAGVMVLEDCLLGNGGLHWGIEHGRMSAGYFFTKTFKTLKKAEDTLRKRREKEEKEEAKEREVKTTSYIKYHDQ